MKNQRVNALATFVTLLTLGSNVYAGCSDDQFAGSWDVVFADGNSCRLVLDDQDAVLIEPDRSLSTCFDPFRGVTTPDSGTYSVEKDCSFSFELIVEGVNIDLYGRLTPNRQIGAGFYVVTINRQVPLDKGSFSILPAK